MRTKPLLFFAFCALAFQPTAGAEFLGYPGLIAGANAAAGSLYDDPFRAGVAPFTIAVNPALTAGNQRLAFDAGYAGIFGGDGSGVSIHYAHLGALFPTRRGVFSGTFQFGIPLGANGVSAGAASNGGKLALASAGFGRDITKNLYVGAALSGGALFSDDADSDWALYGKLGFAYHLPDLGPLLDPACAAVFSYIGKTFDAADSASYPPPFTGQVGFSAVVLSLQSIRAGFSVDISFPSMQNLALDAGLQVEIAGAFVISTGYRVNFRAAADGQKPDLPFAGISYMFSGGAKGGAIGTKSDVRPSGVWKMRGDNAHLVSAGLAVNIGSPAVPPQIILED
ncbi:MAG: hypothetical protein LBG72_10280 [Spirochaetaceae bacterium]|jgi:hypothetical protein|nr:hypothetical protein [Spirochaetaceae bacterium]